MAVADQGGASKTGIKKAAKSVNPATPAGNTDTTWVRGTRPTISAPAPVTRSSTPAPTPSPIVAPTAPKPAKAWNLNYFQKKPGLAKTMDSLRQLLGDDNDQYSNMLETIIEDRYGALQDKRDKLFSQQTEAYDAASQSALNAAREGNYNYMQDNPVDTEVPGLGKGNKPNDVLRQAADDLASLSPDDPGRKAVFEVYQDEYERRLALRNDVRDQRETLRKREADFMTEFAGIAERDENYKGPALDYATRMAEDPTEVPDPDVIDLLDDDEDKDPIREQTVVPKKKASSVGKSSPFAGITTEGQGKATKRIPEKYEHYTSDLSQYTFDGENPNNDTLGGQIKALHMVTKSIAEEAVGSPLMFAIDKMTRPLNGVNNGAVTLYRADKERGNPEQDRSWWADALLGGPQLPKGFEPEEDNVSSVAAAGQNLVDSVDDLDLNVIKNVGKNAAKGFKDGGWTGNAKNPMITSKVIAENAKANPDKTRADSKIYQAGVGFVGDVVFDPLSYVGFGLVTKPARAVRTAKTARDTRQLQRTADAVSEELKKGDNVFVAGPDGVEPRVDFTPEEVFDMLGGNIGPTTNRAVSKKNAEQVGKNIERLRTELDRRINVNKPDAALRLKLAGRRQALQRRRAEVVENAVGSSMTEDLRRSLGISAERGELPDDILDSFDDTLNSSQLIDAIDMGHRYESRLNFAARKKYSITPDFGKGAKSVSVKLREMREGADLQVARGVKPPEEAESIKAGIDEMLAGVRGETESFGDMIPDSLRFDERFEGMDWDELFDRSKTVAYRENEGFKSLAQKAIATKEAYKTAKANLSALRRGNGSAKDIEDAEAAVDRAFIANNITNRRKNSLQGTVIVRMLKQELASKAGKSTFRDVDAAKDIDSQLAEIQRHLDNYDAGRSNTRVQAEAHELKTFDDELSNMTEFELKAKQRDLRRELKNLEGIPAVRKRSLVKNVRGIYNPKQGILETDTLDELIAYDRSKGQFKLAEDVQGNSATTAWLREVTNAMQEKYDELYYPRINAEQKFKQSNTGRKVDNDRIAEDLEYLDSVRGPNGEKLVGSGKSALQGEIAARKKTLGGRARETYERGIAEAARKSAEEARDWVYRELKSSNLTSGIQDETLKLKHPKIKGDGAKPEVAVLRALKDSLDQKSFDLLERRGRLKEAGDALFDAAKVEEMRIIDAELKQVRAYQQKIGRSGNEYMKRAAENRKLVQARLNEDAILRVLNMAAVDGGKRISVNTVFGSMGIPGTEALFKSASYVSDLPIIRETRQAWSDMFVSPMSKLTPENQMAMARANSKTPQIIEMHIDKLKATLAKHTREDRVAAFKHYQSMGKTGEYYGDVDIANDIYRAFEPVVNEVSGKTIKDPDFVTYEQINKFLDAKYVIKLGRTETINNLDDMIRAIRNNNLNTEMGKNLKHLDDPYEVAWNMLIAVEKAKAYKALQHTLRQNFGVRVVNKVENGTIVPAGEGIERVARELEKKHDWKSIPEMGEGYIFPKESVADIRKLIKMMEPRQISEFGRTADQALGIWKAAVTVYNPGYWVRNGIGEVMSSWFDGLTNPKYYRRSAVMGRYMKGEGKQLEALKKQFSLDVPNTKSVAGSQEIARLHGGGKNGKGKGDVVTAEEMLKGYHDKGLKTGFINTEFDRQYSKMATRIEESPTLGKVAAGHNKLRHKGEEYEDYLRMAHFIYAVEDSGARTLDEAFNIAAERVRKYHFDYTDFTQFEKTVMLRAFPFYKWTRKALPLMITMMFQKPGKVMAYPKAMNAVSQGLTTQDISGDDNGFAPNYDGIMPGFIEDMWAYKIAEGGDQDTFLNISTPAMDAYKSGEDPAKTAQTLLNPFIKTPIQMGKNVYDHTLGEQSAGQPGDERGNSLSGDLIRDLLKVTPQGNQVVKNMNDRNMGNPDGDWQDVASFATGIGFYQGGEKPLDLLGLNTVGNTSGVPGRVTWDGKKKDSRAAGTAVGPEDKQESEGGHTAPKNTNNTATAQQRTRKFYDALKKMNGSVPANIGPSPSGMTGGEANVQGFGMPIPGLDPSVMSSDYGPRNRGDGFHDGVDFAKSPGTPILAVRDGEVSVAQSSSSYGNFVVLDHGDAFETLSGHMTEYVVKPGQKVKRGDVIGYVGSTGNSTGPHLHFETWVNGAKVNPVQFLGGS